MIKLLTISTQCLTALAMILTYLAHSWVKEAFGINPFIALPIATLLMIMPYVIDHFFVETNPKDGDLSCIQLK